MLCLVSTTLQCTCIIIYVQALYLSLSSSVVLVHFTLQDVHYMAKDLGEHKLADSAKESAKKAAGDFVSGTLCYDYNIVRLHVLVLITFAFFVIYSEGRGVGGHLQCTCNYYACSLEHQRAYSNYC